MIQPLFRCIALTDFSFYHEMVFTIGSEGKKSVAHHFRYVIEIYALLRTSLPQIDGMRAMVRRICGLIGMVDQNRCFTGRNIAQRDSVGIPWATLDLDSYSTVKS
ncbi:MAG: hypothetical protein LZT29_00081 [Pantoea stewartii]|nr:MAG: hypothetical protein LZT29_00081 [Pantoea stewartii]